MTTLNLSDPARVILGLLLSICGGVAFVLAFPPYEIWPLVLVGYIPVLVAQHRIMPPKLSSLASAVAIAIWLQGYLGAVFAPIGTYMVWLPLFAFFLSLLFDRGQRIFHGNTSYRWFVVGGVIMWAAIEMIRLFLPIAGTWAFIAYPLYRQLWLIQPASIFGIIGTGMLVMIVNHVLALLVIGWLDQKWRPDPYSLQTPALPLNMKLARRWALIGSIVLVAWVGLSLTLLNVGINTPSVRVAAIQPAVSPIISANSGKDVAPIHSRMLEQTREAAEEGAQFIVWPEGSFSWDPQVDDRLGLAEMAVETGAYLVPGYVVVIGEEGFRNEATVIDPSGRFLGIFGKDHPVVFGGETSLSRGSYPVYETELGTLATIICYDLDYTDTTRKMVAGGAQLIGVPSNDWGSIADKHYTHVVFRAIENRVAMVKADGGYNSAIIDPYGRILELAVFPEGGEATLVADLQIGSGKGTVTTRFGDWLGWAALAGLAFFTFGGKWLEKRALITAGVTKVEGRSFQSKLVEILLRFGNKKYYANEEKFAKFMEQKRIENLEPYQLPEKTRKKFNIARETHGGMECYILTGGVEPGRRQILYLHGGAYLNQPVNWHWNFLHDLSQKLDVTITVPIYPKAPHQHYYESFEKVLPVYENLVTRTDPEAVTIMGDSAGGGFGLALAQVALEKGIPQPGNIILISPWLDITLSNPEVPEFEKVDPMIARYGLVEIGKLYAGEQDPNHFMLSPINGQIKGLGQITIITGTHDLLNPEARSFRSLAEEQGVAINFFEYPKMNHCFPLFPIPEAKEAAKQMLEIIKKGGNR